MINVNQITAQLARMPDQALQQYARMHKADPYTLMLALSESNRRKEVRQAAQMGAQDEPDVVDTEIADMAAPAPEDVGIAQLPVGDMNYAAGGIVAFDEGGEVPRYQAGGTLHAALTSYLKGTGQLAAYVNGTPAQRAAIEAAFHSTVGLEGPPRPTPTPGAAATPTQTATTVARSALPRALAASGVAGMAAIPASIAGGLTSAMDYMREQGYPVDTTAPEFATEPTPQQLIFDEQRRRRLITEMPQEERLRKFGTNDVEQALRGGAFAAPAAAAAQPGAKPEVKPGAKPEGQPAPRREPGPGAAPAAAAAPAGITGLDVEGMTRKALAEADKAESPIAGQLRELSAERVKAKEAEAAGLEDIQKRFDNIFAGRKQRLESRESEITKMGEQNKGLAALAAAAELLEGRRGREGEAFGKAFRTGTAQYGAGLDKIRSAQEKIFDARDRLEEVEAQRGELSARELFKARNEVRNTMLSGREDLIKATMEERKIGREAALKIVDNRIRVGITQMEQEGALQRQRIASDATIRAAAMRPSTDDRTMARIVAEYATNPTKLKILEQTDPVMAQMIRAQIQALNVPAVQAQPGAGGARP